MHGHTQSFPCLSSTYLLTTFFSTSFKQKKLKKEWELVLQFFITDLTLRPLEFLSLLARVCSCSTIYSTFYLFLYVFPKYEIFES